MSETKHEGSSVSETETKCFKCSRTDREAVLFATRHKGEEKWVCAQCLPFLIHGG